MQARSSNSQERHFNSRLMSNRWLILALLCTAQFMVVLDFSIVNVALPSIQHDLGFSTQQLQWVISAYSLTFGGLLLLGGRAGDLFGRLWLLIGGLIIFSLASLAGGLASSPTWLITARALQGSGAAFVAPISLSLITTTFAEGEERNIALGVAGAVASTGFTAGVILGGLLTAGPGWRWVMFVNVPLGLLVLILAPLLLREKRVSTGPRQLDIGGAVIVTLALSILVYALTEGNRAGWFSFQTLGLLATALLLLILFVFIESRLAAPLIRLSIFRIRTLVAADLIAMLAPGSFGALMFILTLYLQEVLGYSPLLTGLAFLPIALLLILTTNIGSRLITRLGVRPIFIMGMTIVAGGLLLLAFIRPDSGYLTLLPGLLLVGLGMGPTFAAMTIAATASVSNEEQGLASGLLNTMQQVGSGLAIAIITAITTARTASLLQSGASNKVALTSGLQYALIACAILAILSVVVAIGVIQTKRAASIQK
ncbi:MFS transporter [Dictyobacter alpinus]|uniref:MFS transporter n=1 Tax=Dictyobacter alpinus TaxID=2014873 RepID=A0A402BCL3_9CHLR|nr:MFS transporter [Dictyobacter alpinus]GCE29022.1 MFS transporter [Dictyobacter alpinus]